MRIVRSVYPRGRVYWGRYRVPGGALKQVSLGTEDKLVAEKILRDMYIETEREMHGLIPPRLMRESAFKPLKEHLSDYLANLKTLDVSAKYFSQCNSRLHRMLLMCRWEFLRDVSPDSFQQWRSRQRKIGSKTLNHYLDHARAFLAWMVNSGRASGNPLERIQKIDTRGKEKIVRRALNFEELRRLVAIPSRGDVYHFAAYTGLRREEIAALHWSDIILEGEVPRLVIRASTTKNSKSAALPLHPSLVEVLRRLRAISSDVSGNVFLTMPSSETFNRDLRRCGIQKADSLGRKVDFHALRVTFATLLNIQGVGVRSAMELMRHSDSRLTEKVYTDASALPLVPEIRKLPEIRDNTCQM